jgi:dodecin
MSVARVTEISAISEKGFEDAVQQGIARATKTLRNVEGAWVKDQNVMIEDGNIVGYKINLEVTFVLEEWHPLGEWAGVLIGAPAFAMPLAALFSPFCAAFSLRPLCIARDLG